MGIPSSIEAIVSEIYDLWDRGEIGDNYFIRNIYFYYIIQMFIYFLFILSFPTIFFQRIRYESMEKIKILEEDFIKFEN